MHIDRKSHAYDLLFGLMCYMHIPILREKYSRIFTCLVINAIFHWQLTLHSQFRLNYANLLLSNSFQVRLTTYTHAAHHKQLPFPTKTSTKKPPTKQISNSEQSNAAFALDRELRTSIKCLS